jgi:hypothetical protein
MEHTYLITKYDYLTGKSETLSVHTEKFNAVNEMQSLAADFIQKNDGLEKITTDVSTTTEAGLKHKPVGHYVVVNNNDHVYKWTIYKVHNVVITHRGYFGETKSTKTRISKVFDLDIVQLPFNIFNDIFNVYKRKILDSKFDSLDADNSEAGDLWEIFTSEIQNTKTFKILKDKCDSNQQINVSEVLTTSEEKHVYKRRVVPRKEVKQESRMHMSIMDYIEDSASEDCSAREAIEKEIEEKIPLLKRARGADM